VKRGSTRSVRPGA